MKTLARFILAVLLIASSVNAFGQNHFKLTDTLMLQEIVIRNVSRVYQKGDTTIYNADSFNTHKNSVLEDILKRMPGIVVSSSGAIESDGRPVNKIFINGNEVDLIDLRTLSRNFPAEIIDNIQVTNLYSEASQLSGIKDGNGERIIDLKLKDDVNGGLYGRVLGGYGTNDRFGLNNFSNYMRNGLTISSIATLTNANSTDLSADGESSGPVQGGIQANTFQRNANLNYTYQIRSNIKLTGGYELAGKTSILGESRKKTTYLPLGDNYLQSSHSNGQSEILTHKIVSRLEWKLSKSSSVSAYASYNSSRTKMNKYTLDTNYRDAANVLTRKIDLSNLSARQNLSSSISFQKKWNTKRSVYLKWDIRSGQNNTGSESSYQYSPDNVANNELKQDSKEFSNALQVQYAEMLSKRSTIATDYTFSVQQGRDVKQVFLQDSLLNMNVDPFQSYHNEANVEKHSANLKFQYGVDGSSYVFGINWQALNRSSKSSTENGPELRDLRMAVLPIASVKYKLSDKETIECNYNGVMNAPDLQRLQLAPDYRDSANIYFGNPDLKPETFNSIQTTYSLMDLSKNSNLRASISCQWVDNKIINDVSLNDNKSYQRPINIDGNYTLGMALNYGTNLSKKVRLIGTLAANNNNNVLVSNGAHQVLKVYSINPGLKSILTFNLLDLDISYNYTTALLRPETQSAISTHTLEYDGRIKLPLQFSLQTNLTFVVNQAQDDQFDQSYLFLNASLEKSFEKVPGLFIKMSLNDVLNNYSNYRRVVGENYIEESTYDVLGRYGMVSIVYRYNYFR